MSSHELVVRLLRADDELAWRRLWAGYLEFYQSTLPDAVTDATWTKLTGGDAAFLGTVAELDGEVVGIANSVLHATTWSESLFCYLNDLYVDPEVRGKGIGKLLIDDLLAKAEAQGWARVYWSTKEDNAVARRLYDRYGEADGFVRYARKFE